MPLGIFLNVIILVSCLTTTEYVTVKPDYADPPVRIDPGTPQTIQEIGLILVYYEELLSDWESWGISVYETLEIPLPDSLQYIKDLEE